MPKRQIRPAPAQILDAIAQPLKAAIAENVVALFNDGARGEKPVSRRTDGLFGPRSVAWRVHGDVGAMMIGGIAGLLLQMLHPAVLAGVCDHSNFRVDMQGRLRRTARFIALTTYGTKEEAQAVIARVRDIHDRVQGALPDGTPYAANDPALLSWVHLTETLSFLNGWIRYAEPPMSEADQDRYFAEMARIAEAMGADPIPRSRIEAHRLMEAMRPSMAYDRRTRDIARLVLHPPTHHPLAEPLQALSAQAAIDLLPPWARHMHGFDNSPLTRPLIRAGMFGVAQTLRWAFQ